MSRPAQAALQEGKDVIAIHARAGHFGAEWKRCAERSSSVDEVAHFCAALRGLGAVA